MLGGFTSSVRYLKSGKCRGEVYVIRLSHTPVISGNSENPCESRNQVGDGVEDVVDGSAWKNGNTMMRMMEEEEEKA